MDEQIANAPKEVKEELQDVLTTTLELIEDPNTPPEDRAAYTRIVDGFTKTLKMIGDPDATPEDRATHTRIVKAMTAVMSATVDPSPTPGAPKQAIAPAFVDVADAQVAQSDPQSAPEDPKDKEKIQKIIEETCNALRTVEDPEASPEERNEAKKKVNQGTDSLRSSQYLEFMKEVKRYKPSAVCLETVENRTRQAGWTDGSLWGLSDPSCAAPVAEGARQESSQWNELLLCVQRNPFSSCVEYVPED